MDSGHAVRIAAGVSFDWPSLPPLRENLDGLPGDTTRLQFRRRDSSQRGLSRLGRLTHLWLHQANQAAIGEVAQLPELEVLFVRGNIAADLGPLAANRKLKRLIVIGGAKVENLDWTRGLSPELEVLFLEGFWRVPDLAPLAALPGLAALGVEGGMDRQVTLPTLAPLPALQKLRWLFLAATRVADKSLAPLADIATLLHLECGAFFPDAEFTALRERLPGLHCDWIAGIERHGSLREANAAMLRRWKGG